MSFSFSSYDVPFPVWNVLSGTMAVSISSSSASASLAAACNLAGLSLSGGVSIDVTSSSATVNSGTLTGSGSVSVPGCGGCPTLSGTLAASISSGSVSLREAHWPRQCLRRIDGADSSPPSSRRRATLRASRCTLRCLVGSSPLSRLRFGRPLAGHFGREFDVTSGQSSRISARLRHSER